MTQPRIAFCAYPWDLPDARAADEAAQTGADGVAIAAAYHSVRAATPRAPDRRVVDMDAGLHLPYRPESWAGLPLRPHALEGDPGFNAAASNARAAGLAVEAWVVLTHSETVATANPQYAARSAFGDLYDYALCPSSPAVVDYSARMVSEIVDLGAVDELMIEACGPMGFGHLGAHEKTSGADWTEVDEALLSICFCAGCETGYTGRGLDPTHAAQRVRGAVGSGAATVDDALGDLAEPLLAVRSAARSRMLTAVDASARAAGARKLRYHAQPDRWATGPFAALLGDPLVADGVIAPGDHLLRDLTSVRAASAGTPLGGYFSALPPETPDSIVARWPAVMRELDDIYLYHFGLVSEPRLRALHTVIELVRA